MIQLTPQMRILVALEPADFRKGIDGMAQLCRSELRSDPFNGTVFVFRNRRRTAIKALIYDGRGFWLCHKRLSRGTIEYWPSGKGNGVRLEAHELTVLLCGGDPDGAMVGPAWRRVDVDEVVAHAG